MRAKNSNGVKLALTDMVFLMLLFITAAYVLEMLPTRGMPIDSSYIISIRWDDNSIEDIDLHVRDPLNAHVCYARREAGLMHLDQDDRGELKDTFVDSRGELAIHKKNIEKVEIRQVLPGTYVANIHKYEGQAAPTKVAVSLFRSLNGRVSELFTRELVLLDYWEEKTAFQFEINDSGSLNSIRYDYLSLVKQI
jgi:hypothetical protein